MPRAAAAPRTRPWLARVVAAPAVHAKFVNTLARMEYVGVRKMLKARRSESLDTEGLQHVLEEAGHALRLKRAAEALNGGSAAGVATFADVDTLAGDAAERYLQEVDRACEQLLAQLPEASRAEANYLLSSAVIEIRAQEFYPEYEESLRVAGAPFSVRAILRDEDRHLAEMRRRLDARFGAGADALLARARAHEAAAFARWEEALAAAADAALSRADPGTPR